MEDGMWTLTLTLRRFYAWLELQPWWWAAQALLLSILAAYLIQIFLTRVLKRLTRQTRTELDDEIIDSLRHPVFISVIFLGVNLSMVLLGVEEPYHRYTFYVLKPLAIVIWLLFFNRLAQLILGALSRNRKRFKLIQPQTVPALGNLASALILGGGAYFLLLAWDIDISAWVASAGIIGLAVSLAAKDTLANLFAGLSILADAPYKIGDFIVLESGERGEVTRIGIRSSRIMTRDDIEIIVPNSVLANTKIINEAGGPHPKHRVRVKLAVAYGSDIDQVKALLLEIAREEKRVCEEPAARVRFRRLGDSGLELELLAWVPEPWMRGQTLDALNTEIYKRFTATGIEIPYPRRSVYITNTGGEEHPPSWLETPSS